MVRMSNLLKILFITGVLASGFLMTVGIAQASDLDLLVQEAIDKNNDLAAARERWMQATYRAPQVGSLNDPVLSFALSNYPSDSLASDDAPMTGNELKLAQMFPFPGKLDNRSALAKEQARWLESVYLDNHYQLARKVKDAWYRLYFKNQAIAVVERNIKLVDDIIRLTEVRYETGTGLQQDVLKAHVQRSKLMEQLMSIQQQKTSIESELDSLLSRPEVSSYEVPEAIELPDAGFSLDEFKSAGHEKRPLNAAYQSLVNRYRLQRNLAELDDYPDITLWGSWRFRDDDLPDRGTDFVSAGISVNLPVYREKRRAAKSEAAAAIRMAERQADNFRDKVSESIGKAYSRMEETHQQVDLYREGIIPQTSQSFQAALGSYQVGKVEFISLLDALMTTYRAEMEFHRLSSEYMRSLAWLEAESTLPLLGAPLEVNRLQ